jgi:hypothetical protein
MYKGLILNPEGMWVFAMYVSIEMVRKGKDTIFLKKNGF